MILLKERQFRNDLNDFFKLSNVLSASKLKHHPFIVFNSISEADYLNKLEENIKWKKFELKHAKEMMEGSAVSTYQADRDRVEGYKERIPIYKKELKEAKEKLEQIKKSLQGKEITQIELVDNVGTLITYPVETKVIAQWEGEWSSDFFSFTVEDVKKYLDKKL